MFRAAKYVKMLNSNDRNILGGPYYPPVSYTQKTHTFSGNLNNGEYIKRLQIDWQTLHKTTQLCRWPVDNEFLQPILAFTIFSAVVQYYVKIR